MALSTSADAPEAELTTDLLSHELDGSPPPILVELVVLWSPIAYPKGNLLDERAHITSFQKHGTLLLLNSTK